MESRMYRYRSQPVHDQKVVRRHPVEAKAVLPVIARSEPPRQLLSNDYISGERRSNLLAFSSDRRGDCFVASLLAMTANFAAFLFCIRSRPGSYLSPSQRGSIFLPLLLLLCASAIIFSTKPFLREEQNLREASRELPPLYLPSAEHIKLVTLGFDGFASDILWFNTVNYFGKQYLERKDYRWLFHMCDLVTRLDGNANHVYTFCGTLLSWVAQKPDQSNIILSRGITLHPDNWYFRYLRGFNFWYFLKQLDQAAKDFTVASKLPGAPPFLTSLASRLLVNSDEIDVAISLLNDLRKRTADPAAAEALTEKLKRAILSRDIRTLTRASNQFRNQLGHNPSNLQELVKNNLLPSLPVEPFGGRYAIDRDGNILTTSGEKGLEFHGKTADTGIARQFQYTR